MQLCETVMRHPLSLPTVWYDMNTNHIATQCVLSNTTQQGYAATLSLHSNTLPHVVWIK